MKLIGVTGSSGKSSVCEIVYQYLLHKGLNVSLYASTGCFINGLTRFKDFFQTTLYHKRLKEYLEEDKANNVDVAIIEITAESVLRNDLVHMLPFDVVALSSFYKGLYNHFGSEGKYLACKREILEKL